MIRYVIASRMADLVYCTEKCSGLNYCKLPENTSEHCDKG